MTEYPNFGIGALASLVVEYGKAHCLVRKLKLYQRGSEDYRHKIPFESTHHAALAFPFERIQDMLGTDATLTRKLQERYEIYYDFS